MLDSLDVLKLGHGLSSLKTVFWLNQLGFVKIQKVKLMKRISASGSGRSFPWAEHCVVGRRRSPVHVAAYRVSRTNVYAGDTELEDTDEASVLDAVVEAPSSSSKGFLPQHRVVIMQ